MDPLLFFISAMLLALFYAYWNGANDCANTVATVVATYALPHSIAVVLAGIANAGGLFVAGLLGSAVAKTIAKGVVLPEYITQEVVLGGLVGAIVWAWFATQKGIPVSITHSLVGGIMGAGIAAVGLEALAVKTLFSKIVLGIVLAPLAGFVGGYVLRIIFDFIMIPIRILSSTANRVWRGGQIFSGIWLSASHGMNDGQNAVGIIALAFFTAGFSETVVVEMWMIVVAGIAIGLGTSLHGWRVIKKTGEDVTELEPVDGFAAQTANAGVLTVKSLLGIPVSTTHVAVSSIAGVGGAKGLREVDWSVSRHIGMAWILTIPAAAATGALTHFLLSFLFTHLPL